MSITHYTLGTELARGGMGLIQLARHPRLGQVALKRLLPQTTAFARQSLRTEITLLSQLKHQGVVELVDHGEDEHGPWMAMALIPGTPLRSYLRSTTQTVSVSAPTQSLWTHSLSKETVVPGTASP
ncbi:MAG: protein kinase, partial [Myxococcota bacterium]